MTKITPQQKIRRLHHAAKELGDDPYLYTCLLIDTNIGSRLHERTLDLYLRLFPEFNCMSVIGLVRRMDKRAKEGSRYLACTVLATRRMCLAFAITMAKEPKHHIPKHNHSPELPAP